MGGTDESSNLIELSITEHAEAHKKMWDEHGKWEDYFAWQGLSGLMTKEQIVKEMLQKAGQKGAAISNMKQWGKTKKTVKRDSGYPVEVDGRKIRAKRYWFNNDIIEGQYSLDDYPVGWNRGRLKSVMIKTNKHVHL